MLRIALVSSALALAACATPVPPVPDSVPESARGDAESLRATVGELAAANGNWGRYFAAWRRIEHFSLAPLASSEWIDWWTPQRNLVIEIPGRSDEIVYLVANYDKLGVTPFRWITTLFNGFLDDVFSLIPSTEGAVVNATGLAVVLQQAARLRDRTPHYTYRILLSGLDEQGLRGSRAHLAGLDADEKARIVRAFTVHAPGADWVGICFASDVGNPDRTRSTRKWLRKAGRRVGSTQWGRYPQTAFRAFEKSDFGQDFGLGISHNFIGGLLPQRSWFGSPHRIDVVHLTACHVDDWAGGLSRLIPLPVGRVNGLRDTAARVDPAMLWETHDVVSRLIDRLEKRAGEDSD